jgi:predicted acetyltransferase
VRQTAPVVDVRILDEEHLDASWHLGRLAFGWNTGTRTPPPHDARPDDPFTRWGAFDGDALVGKAVDLHHGQWWGGRVVPASGVAGVAVVPEHRRRGVTRAVLGRLLAGAQERGAAVATLFCTSSAVYRALGFEVGGVMRTVDLPTAELPASGESGVRLRAGSGRDWPAVRELYDAVAADTNGYLTRRGRLFDDPEGDALPDGIDGVSLAESADGRLAGYLTWERGRGYHDDAVVTVLDCLARTPDAAAALVGSLAGWGTVTPRTRLRLPASLDAVALRLPLERAREHRSEVWMHRPLDVVRAVAARGWPAAAEGSVTFGLHDPLLDGNDGAWTLQLSAGEGRLEPAPDAGTVLDVRGWSLLWCGAARSPQLRAAGLLTGPADADAGLDLLLGCGGPSGLLDYF